ncbi:MAG TPA: type II secretion system protein [bacterium]|nr:type II secretion system protein [bacterium]
MRLSTERGFSLTELVVLIVVLCILAVVAVPIYYNLSVQENIRAERSTVVSVREGIETYRRDREGKAGVPPFPTALDDARDGKATIANRFFGGVMVEGSVASGWTKAGNSYTGPNKGIYTYKSSDGSFK